jgi:hypothetical protein
MSETKTKTNTKITRAEYLQVVGLCALADMHYDKLTDSEQAICSLTGDVFDGAGGSKVGDEIWGTAGHNRVDELLRMMQIEVEDE